MSAPRLALLFFGWIAIASPVRAQVVVFEEDFDSADAPVGWSLAEGWDLQTSSASPGSGGSNLRHRGNATTDAATPAVNLGAATSATLTYLARRTDSYGADNLVVQASADGGATFPVTLLAAGDAVPAAGSTWESFAVDLPGEVLGASNVVIRFHGLGLYTSASNARIDDVTITADVPIEITPLSLALAAAVGESETKPFTATNTTAETISIAAPSVDGAAFSIHPSVAVELAGGGSQTYDVTFTAAEQGTFDGSVTLVYGSGSAEVALSGSANGGILGFATASSSALEGEAGVAIPLRLSFTSATGLQGLQFRVDWTGDALAAAGVERGAAVAGTDTWSLSYEAGSGYVDVVLLGEGTASLAAGTYDPLLNLLFDVGTGASASDATLTVAGVIGALAEPEGSDADITASSDAHVITFEPTTAFFEPSATSFDLGDVAAGQTGSATLTVSNPGGNADLNVASIERSNLLFEITPSTARVAPDASVDFTIMFAPTTTSFGRQDADLTFTHDGEGGTDVISLTGKGRGGRGDAEGDGTVDALDVVHAIDFVLGRLTPDPAQKAAADLFPFPAGDGDLDVRDLTVLSQAIARGHWPDDVDLPLEAPEAGKTEPGILLSVNPISIEMSHDVPIRAFQIVLPASEGARVDIEASDVGAQASGIGAGASGIGAEASGVGGQAARVGGQASGVGTGASGGGSDPQSPLDGDARAGSDEVGAAIAYGVRARASASERRSGGGADRSAHELRILVYRPDGGLIPPGVLHLVTHGVIGRPRYVTVIGERRDRLRVSESVWTSSEDALPSTVLPKKPYPNPFRAGSGVLRIPLEKGSRGAIVYDVLGRVVQRLDGGTEMVEWDGSDAAGQTVGSGLYLVHMLGPRESRTHAVQIVR